MFSCALGVDPRKICKYDIFSLSHSRVSQLFKKLGYAMGYHRGIRLWVWNSPSDHGSQGLSLSISHASGFSDFVIRIRATVVAYIWIHMLQYMPDWVAWKGILIQRISAKIIDIYVCECEYVCICLKMAKAYVNGR